ncbi:uncharacterized protein IL334_002518 [Kwoniella shivajii]|uniref:RGS domain-containing protein n=1 Tax=Kwoniella shivajii TaxID=564305 RepID=A0ABZ1CUY3_9TREE|nr:hypothetical protein IL334_002518 [Kwoniella shivajii]
MSESTQPGRSSSIHSMLSVSTHPLSRFNSSAVQPILDDLKLSNILNGETCPPISFIDFASFVANKEFTTENLLFILWFRSYRERFDKLEQKVKETIPIPSTRLGDRYDPYGYIDRPMPQHDPSEPEQDTPVVFSEPFRSRDGGSKPCFCHTENINHKTCRQFSSCHCAETKVVTARRASRLLSITHSLIGSRRPSTISHPNESNALTSILHQATHPPLPPPGTVLAEPAQQPMRDEAHRGFATFLRKGGSKELGISDELREYTRVCLARSTAPEVFLPLYEEIYHVVETQSLPHFLANAKSNINRPKQVFWYAVGAADFGLGAVIYILLTLLLPDHPFKHRAWRLFSIVFATFGAMQFYSAYRGFCTQVWGRSHRQVRPWEMDELDDEETLVESRGASELKEESFMPEPTQSISRREMDIHLPDGVQPLADLGGAASIPSDAGEDDLIKEGGSPASSKQDSVTVALPVLDGSEVSDAERRRLEVRRSTIKAPSPNEAFPISDDMAPPTISFSDTDNRHRREISPFINDEAVFPSSASSTRGSINVSGASSGVPLTRSKSRLHSIASQRANKEISALLSKLLKAPISTEDDDLADPLSTSFKSNGLRKRITKHKDKPKRPKVFGPEKLVEDPRVKKVYRDIKRDILILGGIVASIWIVLCLAVPCAGLAS